MDRLLGEGGAADVYLARRDDSTIPVALKVHQAISGQQDIQFVRFRREILALSKIKHPGLVSVLDAGYDGEWLYCAMEYLPGGTLAELIAGSGPQPIVKSVRMIRDVARALGCLHEHSVVHRDVKPSNILLDADGLPRLSDLGIARTVGDSTLTETGSVIGTLQYMAPEMFEEVDVTPACDVYQLALVLHELLTGSPVIPETQPMRMIQAITSETVPFLNHVLKDVDQSLVMAVGKCLRKTAANRPQNGNEMADLLDECLSKPQGIQFVSPGSEAQNRRPEEVHLPPQSTSPDTNLRAFRKPILDLVQNEALGCVLSNQKVMEAMSRLSLFGNLRLAQVYQSRPSDRPLLVFDLVFIAALDGQGKLTSANRAVIKVVVTRIPGKGIEILEISPPRSGHPTTP